jgi:hypothetical protein
MATKIKLEMNIPAMIRVMQSPGVMAELTSRANRVRAAAGPGHMVTSRVGRTRARVSVITASGDAMRREATERSLTRALNAARG